MYKRFSRLLPSLLLVTTIVSLLSGCATVDQKIMLSYATVDRSFGRQSGEISVSRVDPKNLAKNSKGEWIVGSINNANGVHRADILTDRSIGEWITDALLLELKHAGYTVSYTPTLPAAAARGVLISDINASLNINKEAVTDRTKNELKFNVDIFLNGAKAKTFSVASRDSKTLPLSASREDLDKIMLQSLQDAMLQIIPEITELKTQK
ncbi:MAG: hypothetical protein WCP33_04790 [Deltaproteobacteria bacterium]